MIFSGTTSRISQLALCIVLCVGCGSGATEDMQVHDSASSDRSVACPKDPTQIAWSDNFDWTIAPIGQDLIAPDSFFKENATACEALDIATCRRVDGCGAPAFYCWRKSTEAYSNQNGEFAGVFEPGVQSASIPCSKKQLGTWIAAEQSDCAQKVDVSALPSVIAPLLSGDALPKEVCANLSGTRFRIDSPSGVVRVVYWPAGCSGHQPHTGWSMCVSPAATGLWSKALPMLQCKSLALNGDQFGFAQRWHILAVGSNCAAHCAMAYTGSLETWGDFLKLAAASTATCGNP